MPSVDILGPFLVAVLVICLAPGADMAFVVACGLSGGRRAALLAACGISLGVTVWVLATAAGLGVLLGVVPALRDGLLVVGAMYLGYLAWRTWRDAGGALLAGTEVLGATRRMFWRGVVTNLANPKVGLFFTAFLPRFTQPGHGPVFVQLVVLGLLLQVVGLVVDSAVGLAAGSARDVVSYRPAIRVGLERSAAVVLAVLAVAVGYDLLLP